MEPIGRFWMVLVLLGAYWCLLVLLGASWCFLVLLGGYWWFGWISFPPIGGLGGWNSEPGLVVHELPRCLGLVDWIGSASRVVSRIYVVVAPPRCPIQTSRVQIPIQTAKKKPGGCSSPGPRYPRYQKKPTHTSIPTGKSNMLGTGSKVFLDVRFW